MTDETRAYDAGDVAASSQRSGEGSSPAEPGGVMRVRPEFLPASDGFPGSAPVSGPDAFTGPNPFAASRPGPEGADPFAPDPYAPRDAMTDTLVPFASESGDDAGRRQGGEASAGWGNPSGPVPPSPQGPYAGPSAYSGGPGGLGGPYGPPPPRNPYGMGPGWAPPPGAPRVETGAAGSRGPRTGVLATLAVVIALVASTAGSVGTYLLTRSNGGVDPSYSLGTPTGAIVNRAPDSVAGVASKVLPSVVSLDVRGNSEAGTGSGFVIKGGYVVTNNHVVAAAALTGNIKITFNDKKSTAAKIVGRDPSSDIAVVKPDDTFGAPEITIGNSDRVVVGDPVIAIGSPLGLTGTVTTGIVSSLNRPVTAGGESGSESSFINAIQTDAAINPGNSGGPLVNGAGEVIGVNSAIATLGNSSFGSQSGSIGLGFSIPINHVRRVAEELITTGSAKKSRIGVQLDPDYQGEGVRIATTAEQGQPPVVPGGPADKAGMKPGDVILAIDGNPVSDQSELIVAIRSKAPGTTVTLKFRRDGRDMTASVTIDAIPVPTPQPS
ncbi:trypsin-like peptidase domain-containing protein [Sphaerisporangium sp. NPDC051011]|uniref:S1C family serine protease n=1 Tax=Sphaerisporangium sp. NPDC051011 TaxID=3155792 RepID=UPI0034034147